MSLSGNLVPLSGQQQQSPRRSPRRKSSIPEDEEADQLGGFEMERMSQRRKRRERISRRSISRDGVEEAPKQRATPEGHMSSAREDAFRSPSATRRSLGGSAEQSPDPGQSFRTPSIQPSIVVTPPSERPQHGRGSSVGGPTSPPSRLLTTGAIATPFAQAFSGAGSALSPKSPQSANGRAPSTTTSSTLPARAAVNGPVSTGQRSRLIGREEDDRSSLAEFSIEVDTEDDDDVASDRLNLTALHHGPSQGTASSAPSAGMGRTTIIGGMGSSSAPAPLASPLALSGGVRVAERANSAHNSHRGSTSGVAGYTTGKSNSELEALRSNLSQSEKAGQRQREEIDLLREEKRRLEEHKLSLEASITDQNLRQVESTNRRESLDDVNSKLKSTTNALQYLVSVYSRQFPFPPASMYPTGAQPVYDPRLLPQGLPGHPYPTFAPVQSAPAPAASVAEPFLSGIQSVLAPSAGAAIRALPSNPPAVSRFDGMVDDAASEISVTLAGEVEQLALFCRKTRKKLNKIRAAHSAGADVLSGDAQRLAVKLEQSNEELRQRLLVFSTTDRNRVGHEGVYKQMTQLKALGDRVQAELHHLNLRRVQDRAGSPAPQTPVSVSAAPASRVPRESLLASSSSMGLNDSDATRVMPTSNPRYKLVSDRGRTSLATMTSAGLLDSSPSLPALGPARQSRSEARPRRSSISTMSRRSVGRVVRIKGRENGKPRTSVPRPVEMTTARHAPLEGQENDDDDDGDGEEGGSKWRIMDKSQAGKRKKGRRTNVEGLDGDALGANDTAVTEMDAYWGLPLQNTTAPLNQIYHQPYLRPAQPIGNGTRTDGAMRPAEPYSQSEQPIVLTKAERAALTEQQRVYAQLETRLHERETELAAAQNDCDILYKSNSDLETMNRDMMTKFTAILRDDDQKDRDRARSASGDSLLNNHTDDAVDLLHRMAAPQDRTELGSALSERFGAKAPLTVRRFTNASDLSTAGNGNAMNSAGANDPLNTTQNSLMETKYASTTDQRGAKHHAEFREGLKQIFQLSQQLSQQKKAREDADKHLTDVRTEVERLQHLLAESGQTIGQLSAKVSQKERDTSDLQRRLADYDDVKHKLIELERDRTPSLRQFRGDSGVLGVAPVPGGLADKLLEQDREIQQLKARDLELQTNIQRLVHDLAPTGSNGASHRSVSPLTTSVLHATAVYPPSMPKGSGLRPSTPFSSYYDSLTPVTLVPGETSSVPRGPPNPPSTSFQHAAASSAWETPSHPLSSSGSILPPASSFYPKTPQLRDPLAHEQHRLMLSEQQLDVDRLLALIREKELLISTLSHQLRRAHAQLADSGSNSGPEGHVESTKLRLALDQERAEVTRLRVEVNDKEKRMAQLRQLTEEKLLAIADRDAEHSATQNELKTLQARNHDLREEVSRLKHHQDKDRDFKRAELEVLKRKQEDDTIELDRLRRKEVDHQAVLVATQQRESTLRVELAQARDELARATAQHALQLGELERLRVWQTESRSLTDRQRSQSQEHTTELERLRLAEVKGRGDMERWQGREKQLVDELASMHTEVRDQKDALGELRAHTAQLQHDLLASAATATQLKQEHDAVKHHNETLKAQLATLQSSVQDAAAEREQLREAQRRVVQLQHDHQRVLAEKHAVGTEAETLRKALTHPNPALDEEMKRLKTREALLARELSALKEGEREAMDEMTKLRQHEAAQRDEIVSLRRAETHKQALLDQARAQEHSKDRELSDLKQQLQNQLLISPPATPVHPHVVPPTPGHAPPPAAPDSERTGNLYEFCIAAKHLIKMDFLSDSDPMVSLFIQNPDTGLFEWHAETEWIENNHNPFFYTTFKVYRGTQPDRTLRFIVYDVDMNSVTGDIVKKTMGEVTLQLNDLIHPKTLLTVQSFGLRNPKNDKLDAQLVAAHSVLQLEGRRIDPRAAMDDGQEAKLGDKKQIKTKSFELQQQAHNKLADDAARQSELAQREARQRAELAQKEGDVQRLLALNRTAEQNVQSLQAMLAQAQAAQAQSSQSSPPAQDTAGLQAMRAVLAHEQQHSAQLARELGTTQQRLAQLEAQLLRTAAAEKERQRVPGEGDGVEGGGAGGIESAEGSRAMAGSPINGARPARPKRQPPPPPPLAGLPTQPPATPSAAAMASMSAAPAPSLAVPASWSARARVNSTSGPAGAAGGDNLALPSGLREDEEQLIRALGSTRAEQLRRLEEKVYQSLIQVEGGLKSVSQQHETVKEDRAKLAEALASIDAAASAGAR